MTEPTSRLPPELSEVFVALSAPAWRERKQAVESLCGLIDRTPAGASVLDTLTEHLLTRLLDPDTIDGRASAHDVLVHMGSACLPALTSRLANPGSGAGTRMLVDLLGEIGDDSHVELLVEFLSAPASDENLRASAATALGIIGGPQAVAALRRLLRSDSDMLQVYALDALRTARAMVPVVEIEPLVASPLSRVGAAALLGLTGDVAALPLLVELLDDPMAGVRAAAGAAMVELEDALGDRGTIVEGAVHRLGGTTLGHVRELIGHPDRAVRAAAIRLAGLAHDAGAIDPVLSAMDDPLVQERAFEMVRTMGADAAPGPGAGGRVGRCGGARGVVSAGRRAARRGCRQGARVGDRRGARRARRGDRARGRRGARDDRRPHLARGPVPRDGGSGSPWAKPPRIPSPPPCSARRFATTSSSSSSARPGRRPVPWRRTCAGSSGVCTTRATSPIWSACSARPIPAFGWRPPPRWATFPGSTRGPARCRSPSPTKNRRCGPPRVAASGSFGRCPRVSR